MRVDEDNGVKKTTEDYLEAILMIHERQGYVRSIRSLQETWARRLSVLPESFGASPIMFFTSSILGSYVL